MPANLKKVERELAVTLPKPFVAAVRAIESTCTDWPDDYADMSQRRLITDSERLIAINKQFRDKPARFVQTPKELAKTWPNEYIVFASDPLCCFFDSSEKDPEIHTISGKRLGTKDHLSPTHFSNFRELTKVSKFQYTAIRKAVRRRDQESRMRERAKHRPAAKIECPDLIAEGWSLARPALRLTESGDDYAAIWGGSGVVPPPKRGSWRHWITIGCSRLPLNPRELRGLISVYESEDDLKIKVVHNDRMRLPRNPDGEKLFGAKFKCLPSIGVVLSKGSRQAKQWLKGQNIWSGDAEGAHFEDQEPIDQYEIEFQKHHPHFLEDCDAMLGGWGAVYPDSKWRNLMTKSLLVTTFRDAEPWLEVYDSGKAFSCFSRIT